MAADVVCFSTLVVPPFAKIYSEVFDPRKMNANFLEANFEYFGLSTARDDENNENCPSSFLAFGQKSC